MRAVEIDGGWLAYELKGSGPPLVLLNGGAMDYRQWDAVLPALAEDHSVLRYDPRGWGRSSLPGKPFSNVADLEQLLDELGLERVALLGSSFGGALALDFALERPARVSALVLLGSSLEGYAWSRDFLEREARFLRAPAGERPAVLLADPYFLPGAASDPALAARAEELLLRNARLFDWDPGLLRHPERLAGERLGELSLPVLVLTPELDHPDVRAIGALLAQRIPGAHELVLSGAGHMAHMERPAELARAALDFLARPEVAAGWPLVWSEDFERPGAAQAFVFSDAAAWRVAQVAGRSALEQFAASRYEPAQRSPHNLALLERPRLGSFVLEACVLQSGREYPHRDLVFVFGFSDPEHFCYAHLASSADENADHVMRVDGAPRRPVTSARTAGVRWGEGEWQRLRVERDADAASIRVWLGDAPEPALVAGGTAPGAGWIGFGSFDDTAAFDDVRVWAVEASDQRVAAFPPVD
jgi:pimeloyl-ACP methyl ester carboxylesterase